MRAKILKRQTKEERNEHQSSCLAVKKRQDELHARLEELKSYDKATRLNPS